MVNWHFRDYLDENGYSDVEAHYLASSDQLQDRFFSFLMSLRTMPFHHWHAGYHKQLTGLTSPLSELRFVADKVEQRPLGIRTGETEFTLLYWAVEKGNKFHPKNACDIALKRKAIVLADRKRSRHAHWTALD